MYSPPPSDLHNFPWERLLEWSVLVGLIVGLIWAAKSIMREKNSFLDESYPFQWGKITLPIARWWTKKILHPSEIIFYRADTHYEWKSHFLILEQAIEEKISLQEVEQQWENSNQILFDEHETTQTIRSSDLFQNTQINEQMEAFIRKEGTATKAEVERLYVDIIFFRLKNDTKTYQCSSISSVLNGSVEGPFFEESLKLASFS